MALPVPVVKGAKLKIADESRSYERTMRVSRKVADMGSKIWCQGGASECTPGYKPFSENGIGSYFRVSEELGQKAERDGEKGTANSVP